MSRATNWEVWKMTDFSSWSKDRLTHARGDWEKVEYWFSGMGNVRRTVEGELDDISGSGQTRSAHALCDGIPVRLTMAN